MSSWVGRDEGKAEIARGKWERLGAGRRDVEGSTARYLDECGHGDKWSIERVNL